MTTTRWKQSVGEVGEEEWSGLSEALRVDHSHGYLRFREHVEPGRPVIVTAHDAHGLSGALHGALSTPLTGLFSHPWKLLTAAQFRRPDEEGGEAAREEHAVLAREACGNPPTVELQEDGVPTAGALTAALGEALVIRGFDTSQAGIRQGLDAEESRRATTALVGAVQASVRAGRAGAVVFPFVRTEDTVLREVLAEFGFRAAQLTATTHFEVGARSSYEELLAGLSRRHRHRFRKEEREFHEAGLHLENRALAGVVRRVAELETSNTAKHGGDSHLEKVVAVRTAMARLLGSRVRVPVALRGEHVFACGIHLTDADDCCVLMYGSEEAESPRSTAYPCLTFYEPLRHATANGVTRVRFGFEGFGAKLIRGARLSPRETWVWTPDPAALDAVHRLMRFLGDRWATHRARLPDRTR